MSITAAPSRPVSAEAFRSAFDSVFAQPSPLVRATEPLSIDIVQSPVGTLLLAASPTALHALGFIDMESIEARLRSLQKRFGGSAELATNEILETARRQLDEYFVRRRTHFELPLSYKGSFFEQKVWSALLKIEYGRTWSYLDLAIAVGDRGATRAVGTANGANPLAIVIPCHRVVNASGELGGYGGGLWRKRILLDLEKGQSQFAF